MYVPPTKLFSPASLNDKDVKRVHCAIAPKKDCKEDSGYTIQDKLMFSVVIVVFSVLKGVKNKSEKPCELMRL